MRQQSAKRKMGGRDQNMVNFFCAKNFRMVVESETKEYKKMGIIIIITEAAKAKAGIITTMTESQIL